MAIICYEEIITWKELLSLEEERTALEKGYNGAYAKLQVFCRVRKQLQRLHTRFGGHNGQPTLRKFKCSIVLKSRGDSKLRQNLLEIQRKQFDNLFLFGSELIRRRIYGFGIKCFEQALSVTKKDTMKLFDYMFGINLAKQAKIAHESLHRIRIIIKTLFIYYYKNSINSINISSHFGLLITDIVEYVGNFIMDVEAEIECTSIIEEHGFKELVGVSREWRTVLADIKKYSKTDKTIFISGPPGIGKEKIAKAIGSLRKSNKFIALNCASIADDLARSEMFGHKRGAFTGATNDHAGYCEEVKDGVLFLDEIDKASLKFQALLLRLLQEGEFKVIGDKAGTNKKFMGTVISAGNKDMKKMMKDGTFLDDVYERLSNFVITVPPLSIRPEDIEALILFYLEKSPQIKEISMEAITSICNFMIARSAEETNRSNNVRELFYLLDRIIIDAAKTIKINDLPKEFASIPVRYQKEYYKIPDLKNGETFKMIDLEQVFDETRDIEEIAKLFGVTSQTIYNWMDKFNVKVPVKHSKRRLNPRPKDGALIGHPKGVRRCEPS